MSETKERKYLLMVKIGLLLLIISAGFNGLFAAVWVKGQRNGAEVMKDTSSQTMLTSEEERAAYAQDYYEKKLRKLLTPEELNALAQEQWSYILSVNGRQFTGNTLYIENTSNVRIVLAEVANTEELLPEAVLREGSLWRSEENKTLADYMTIYASDAYELSSEQQGNNTKYTYDFQNLPKGTVITLQLDSLLKEKIDREDHIKSNRVQIVIR